MIGRRLQFAKQTINIDFKDYLYSGSVQCGRLYASLRPLSLPAKFDMLPYSIVQLRLYLEINSSDEHIDSFTGYKNRYLAAATHSDIHPKLIANTTNKNKVIYFNKEESFAAFCMNQKCAGTIFVNQDMTLTMNYPESWLAHYDKVQSLSRHFLTDLQLSTNSRAE